MYTVENNAGRLIEVKLASPLSVGDVQQFTLRHMQIMQRIPGRYVGVVNLRQAYVFPAVISDALSKMLSSAASHVERTALLVGESAVFGLQVERVIRESNNPDRRAFRSAPELVAWLSEVLTPPERTQLERFIPVGAAVTAPAPYRFQP